MTWWRSAIPLVILVSLALAASAAFSVPTLGFPLIFVICALSTVAIDPVRRPVAVDGGRERDD